MNFPWEKKTFVSKLSFAARVEFEDFQMTIVAQGVALNNLKGLTISIYVFSFQWSRDLRVIKYG
jgi:hypothetical protein